MKITAKKFKNFYYSVRRNLDRDIFINENAKGSLTFGVCLFNRFTVSHRGLQVMGDELQARAIVKEVLLHCPGVRQCRIYDIKEAKAIADDIAFVMWPDYPILEKRPKRYILWLQNAGFENRMDSFLERYDYVFSPSRACCDKFAKVKYLPMACEDIGLFKKVMPDGRFETQVCFVGNYTIEQRPAWFERDFILPAARYSFGLWGHNWDRSEIKEIREAARGRLEPGDVPMVYSSAKIVLSNHGLIHRHEGIITTRIYEALACEAFVISDWFSALDEFKEHVVFTSGGKDLEDKLGYYLSHPEKREEKIKGAREFIAKRHTFKNRVETIAKNIGLEFL